MNLRPSLRQALLIVATVTLGSGCMGSARVVQRNHAGGRQSYERFWGAISRISVTNVKGSPPGSAQATITYYFKDGRVIRERTGYGLINDNGRLKINSSTVLSSTPLS